MPITVAITVTAEWTHITVTAIVPVTVYVYITTVTNTVTAQRANITVTVVVPITVEITDTITGTLERTHATVTVIVPIAIAITLAITGTLTITATVRTNCRHPYLQHTSRWQDGSATVSEMRAPPPPPPPPPAALLEKPVSLWDAARLGGAGEKALELEASPIRVDLAGERPGPRPIPSPGWGRRWGRVRGRETESPLTLLGLD